MNYSGDLNGCRWIMEVMLQRKEWEDGGTVEEDPRSSK